MIPDNPSLHDTPLSPKLGLADIPRPESLLVDIQTLALMLDRSIGSLERDLARGLLIQPVRLGGSRKWRRAEILEWVEAGCPSQQIWEKRSQN